MITFMKNGVKSMTHAGSLTVITGPSGVGKGSLVNRLLEKHSDIWLSISATTRQPRSGEKNGEQYFFMDREEFMELVEEGGFIEWAEFAGNLYGTPIKQLREKLEKGIKVILEIELEGARQVQKKFPEAYRVFISPPSFDELEKRIKGRGTDSKQAISKRLLRAKEEMKAQNEFDAIIINNQLSSAVIELESIIGIN